MGLCSPPPPVGEEVSTWPAEIGGNELRFPRVGKREVKSGATPAGLWRNSPNMEKKRRSGGFCCVCELGS